MTKFGFGTTSILDSLNKLHENTALVQQMKEEDEKDVQLRYYYIFCILNYTAQELCVCWTFSCRSVSSNVGAL